MLAKIGLPAVPVLLGWLRDPRWFVVSNVVHVLGKIGDAGAFERLVPLLGHPHGRVRIENALAFGAELAAVEIEEHRTERRLTVQVVERGR